jgi:hypothetical protein
MSNKQCYYDLCIFLNPKRGFLADVFWEIRKRECIVQKWTKDYVSQVICYAESITLHSVAPQQFRMLPTAVPTFADLCTL